jgi:serine phosphatase RsbU (regulator of sigma subunit)
MQDAKIRIKLHAVGSLAQRAVIVSLCLLVVPLFLHSLYLYREEYEQTLTDIKENLAIIAKGQKAILEERISVEWQVLDAAAAKTEPAFQEQLQIFEMPMPSGMPDHFAIVSLQQDAFIAGIKTSATRALAISTPIDTVFAQLTDFEKTSFPLSLAFVDKEGKALIGAKQETSISIQLPIEGADFFLYLSIPEGAVERLHKEWYFFHFLTLLFFIGVIGGFIVWLITKRISKPLAQLCKVMEKVGEGAVHARYAPDKMGFEINELGKQFNQTLDQLLLNAEEAERQRIGRERLAEELKIGHDIQSSLLPKHLPELKGIEIASGFLPAREVGGDFYDLFPMPDGRLLIAIADMAGKGISACLYAVGLRSMLRTLALGKGTLSEIVLGANDLFWRDARHTGMFVTLWIGIYDPETKTLEYCSQGHPPAYLMHQGTSEKLWTPGIAMGAQSFDMVSSKHRTLKVGDLLFLYTDGILEAHSLDNQLFGKERLQEFLIRSSTLPPPSIVEHLLKEIEVFSQGAPQHDDITLLVIRIMSSMNFS